MRAMRIGPYTIDPPVGLAPMAGVTDKPFRQLCKRLGAGLAVSEMTTADPRLWHTRKSLRRGDHAGEPDPVSVQIAGYDPVMLAEAARYNVDHGAQIIDINMGCPAKKVCNVYSGSALLQNEELVARICAAVVRAVEVPVTLKIRTGWNRDNRNGVRIAKIAQGREQVLQPPPAVGVVEGPVEGGVSLHLPDGHGQDREALTRGPAMELREVSPRMTPGPRGVAGEVPRELTGRCFRPGF